MSAKPHFTFMSELAVQSLWLISFIIPEGISLLTYSMLRKVFVVDIWCLCRHSMARVPFDPVSTYR